MDELTIIRLAIRYLPTFLVVVVLLNLLTEEYLRLMEMAGLIRRPSPADKQTESDADEKEKEKEKDSDK